MTVSKEAKVQENRLRRMAERQGYQLVKSRRRDPRAVGYGTWGLVDPFRNAWVALGDPHNGYGLSLEAVEAWLRGDDTADDPRKEQAK